jgi:exopolysaccharide biosynthesis operon protein EpsL
MKRLSRFGPLRGPVWRTLMGMTLLLCSAARADEFDTLNFDFGKTFVYDSNVFRLNGAADPNVLLGTPKKSDTLDITSIGVRFGKSYSLQRFEFSASFIDYKYQQFNFLSFDTTNYSGAWRWSLTPRLRGNLTASQSQTLNSFIDFRAFVRNLRTDTNRRFDVEYEIDGVWRLVGALSESKNQNALPIVQTGDARNENTEAGIRYAFPSGSRITAVSRLTKGTYLNIQQPNFATLFDNKYEVREQEASLFWLFSGKSSFDARLAYYERRHPNIPQRNFSGVVGNATLNWGITGKSRFSASYVRDLGQFLTQSSSYSVGDRFILGPSWDITAKLQARARFESSSRSFLGPVGGAAATDRVDRFQTMSAGVDWAPYRWVSVSASLQNDKRSSSVAGLDFSATTATLTAQLTF